MAIFPLEGYRVANFGWIWSAPVMGHLLADFGAEVIKIESRVHLDYWRRDPRPLVGDKPDVDLCPNFLNWNHSVLSITANFAKPGGAAMIKRLIALSDVVIENYPPRVLRARGLDYERLREVRPDIVMLSLPAVGQYGPLRDVMTFGPSLGALAGLDATLGYVDGEAAFEYCYTDPVASVVGAFLILAALRHRARTGEGQYIDMAQMEATTCLLGEMIMEHTMTGRVMGLQGNRSRWMAPHNFYPCKGEDRWIAIAVKTDEEWKSLCQAIGYPPWTRDEKFADMFSRLKHEEELDKLISDWTISQTDYEVMHLLQAAGVAAAPHMNDAELYFDPHHRETQTWIEVNHPKASGVPIYNVTWNLSETPGKIQRPSPLLGQHNDYVYGEVLGLPQEEIARLTEEKVFY